MRYRWKIAACLVACLAAAPAIAQQVGGSSDNSDNVLWNAIGLVGLLGLRGLWRESDNDGYTNDPV